MNAQTPYELYRVILDYEALQEAFIDRVEDLNVSRITIDEVGGFTPGHASKLLCVPPIKKLGAATLEKMLKATGTALLLVIDDERFAPVKAQMSKRKKTMRPVARIKRVRGLFTKENARKYGKRRWDGIPDEMRKKMMRKVAKARWHRRRREIASVSAPPTESPSTPV